MNTSIKLSGLLSILILLASCGSHPKDTSSNNNTVETAPPELTYDSLRAAKCGADDYGMKKYVLAFLEKGPNRPTDPAKAQELQMAHMANIDRLAEEGKLAVAGPFFGDGDLRGLYIFNVMSIEEAEELTNTDPAIQSGSLKMDLKEWYGSAALMEVNDIHKVISKNMITGEE